MSVEVDKANKVYARVIEVLTLAGLALMIVGLALYLSGAMPVYVSLDKLAEYWDEEAPKFWKIVKGFEPSNYDWIFKNLSFADIVSVLGVVVLPIGVIVGVVSCCIAYSVRKDVMIGITIVVLIVMLIALLGPYIGITIKH